MVAIQNVQYQTLGYLNGNRIETPNQTLGYIDGGDSRHPMSDLGVHQWGTYSRVSVPNNGMPLTAASIAQYQLFFMFKIKTKEERLHSTSFFGFLARRYLEASYRRSRTVIEGVCSSRFWGHNRQSKRVRGSSRTLPLIGRLSPDTMPKASIMNGEITRPEPTASFSVGTIIDKIGLSKHADRNPCLCVPGRALASLDFGCREMKPYIEHLLGHTQIEQIPQTIGASRAWDMHFWGS